MLFNYEKSFLVACDIFVLKSTLSHISRATSAFFNCMVYFFHPVTFNLGFPSGSAGKESAYNAGDLGLIPGLGRSPGEGKGYPLQYSGLENSMNCIGHGIAKSWIRLSNFHFTFNLSVVLIIKYIFFSVSLNIK